MRWFRIVRKAKAIIDFLYELKSVLRDGQVTDQEAQRLVELATDLLRDLGEL